MKAILALASSKSYTKETVEGAGAVAGVPCQIQSITDIEGGHRITFLWEDNEGVEHTSFMDVKDGEKGDQGDKGDTGDQGDPGHDGFSPRISVKKSTEHQYILTITDAYGSYDTPNLKGSGGGGGGTFDYDELDNKPTINGVELVGNKTTEELGITTRWIEA